MRPRPSLFCSLALLLAVAPCLAAQTAGTISGTVTDKTTGKVSAGDTVVLIQLQQSMQESTRTTTDAHGHYSLAVPDDGMHLVRVTHDKAAYFQPVTPGEHTANVTVYDAAPTIPGVSTGVEELHIEATPTELHVVEVLQVLNDSAPPRTQFGPKGYEFYLPEGALVGRTGAITQGGMPVQTPAVPQGDPGHFSFLFPIRPGETQFGIAYTLPYTGKYTFVPRLATTAKTFAVLVPTSMTLTLGSGSALVPQGTRPGTQTYIAQNVDAGAGPQFTLSGTGSLPDQSAGPGNDAGPNASTANAPGAADANAPAVSNSELAGGRGLNNPLDASGDRDPWAKYKWWILSGLAVLLAGAAGVLLRRPRQPALLPVDNSSALLPFPTRHADAHPPAPAVPQVGAEPLLLALKEELWAVETERLQGRLPESDYREARAAIELILARSLRRRDGDGTPSQAKPALPALVDQDRATVATATATASRESA